MLAITFRNISALADVSDYEYEVLIGGGPRYKVIEAGHVRGHKRADGWKALLEAFVARREPDTE